MRAILNKKSIFTKLLVTYSAMSIITSLFIGIVSYEVSTRIYAQQIESDNRLLLEQYKALIETDIMKPAMELVMELLVNSEYRDINNYFQDEVDYGDLYWYDKEISESVKGDRGAFIRDVYLHNINNNLILSAKEGLLFLETRDNFWWSLESREEKAQNVGWGVQWYENTIYGLRYRQKYPLSDTAQTIGYIVVDVNVEALLELMKSLSAYQEGELLLLEDTGQLIPIVGEEFQDILNKGMDLEQQSGGFSLSAGKEEYYFTYSSPFANEWRLAMLTPVTEFYASSVFLQWLIAVLTALCIVVGILLSIQFSRNIYKPVREIMGKLQKGDKKRGVLTGNEYEFIDREILHLNVTVQELSEMLKSYNPMIEYNILSGVINKTMRDRSVLQQRMGLLGFQPEKSGVTAVVIKIRKLLLDIMDEKNLQIFKIHIINLVKSVCTNQCVISEYKPDEIVAMVFLDKDEIEPVVRTLEEKCSINPTGSLSIGVGGSYEDPMSLGNSYTEAKEALQYSYFNYEKMLFYYSEFELLEIPGEDVLGKCNKEFDKQIKSGNLEAALDNLFRIEQIVKTFPYKYEYMNRKLLELVGIFARYCKEVNMKTQIENIETRFLNADRLYDFLIPFREMVTDVICRYVSDNENRNENLVQNICEYIDNNLSEDVSLSMIADKMHVSEGHLSRVFKKQMDKSIMEYITEKRMEKAKRLLTQTSLSVEKIANLSGYRTPHYFGQKFKETYGYTPSRYRELVRQKDEI